MPKKAKKSGVQTIFWWVLWITLTIVSFFFAAAFWTPVIAKHYGSIRETKASMLWVLAVFGSWIIILIPLIILMYHKVDKAYEDARIQREKSAQRFQSIYVAPDKRKLPENLAQKFRGLPETIKGGYLVDLILKDGRTVANVFIAGGQEVLGIYDAAEMNFAIEDIVDFKAVDMNNPPFFQTQNWLRLDGVSARV